MYDLHMRVIGSYEIIDRPELTAQCETLTGRHLCNDPVVTIRLLTEKSVHGQTRARFLRESSLCQDLHHPHIFRVLEVGEHEGRPYCVEEKSEDTTLKELLSSSLSLKQGMSILAQCADGLAYAHSKGVIHRDLKPEVIYVSREYKAKLGGFALARKTTDDSGLTKTGFILGTPSYLAPERLITAEGKATADLYSLGIILYELFAGAAPYTGSLTEILRGHLEKEPERPPQMPQKVWELTQQLLEKAPEDRLASAKSLARSLRQLDSQNDEKVQSPIDSPKKQFNYRAFVSQTILLFTLLFIGYSWQGSPSKPTATLPLSGPATASSPKITKTERTLKKRQEIVEGIASLHQIANRGVNNPHERQAAIDEFFRLLDELTKLPPLSSSQRYEEGAKVVAECSHFLVSLGLIGMKEEGSAVPPRLYPYEYYSDLNNMAAQMVKTNVPHLLAIVREKTLTKTGQCSSRYLHLRLIHAIALGFTFQRPDEKRAIEKLEAFSERYKSEALAAAPKGKELLIYLHFHQTYYTHVYSLLDNSIAVSRKLKDMVIAARELVPPTAKALPLSLSEEYCLYCQMIWFHRNQLHDEIADLSLVKQPDGHKTPALQEAIRYGKELMEFYAKDVYVAKIHRPIIDVLHLRDRKTADRLRAKWAPLFESSKSK